MSVTVKRLVVGPIEENCYIVYDENREEKNCFLVDPGAGGTKIINALKALDRIPAAIFLTHGHFDHIMAVDWLLKEFPELPVYSYEKEEEVLTDPKKSLLAGVSKDYFLKDVRYLPDGKEMEMAGIPVKLIATSGHTAGSSCLYLEAESILFSGDTLFRESAGRTDLPTGNDGEIRKSILEKLKPLPEKTLVYPGHGEETDIGHEKKFNFIMLGCGKEKR